MAQVAAPALGDALRIKAMTDVKTFAVVTKRSRAQLKTSELESCDDQTKRRRLAAQQATMKADKAMKEA